MQNAGLDEAQTGIKIARKNINNLRYTDDITLMVEREEELKSQAGSKRDCRLPEKPTDIHRTRRKDS